MKKIYILAILAMLFVFASCDPDEVKPSKSGSNTSKVEKPTISVSTAATTTTDLTVVFKVTSSEDPKVTLHYGTTSSCNKASTCYLYNGGYSKTKFYKASHSGFSKGTKLYFYGEASNSGGSSKTSVDYRVTKR